MQCTLDMQFNNSGARAHAQAMLSKELLMSTVTGISCGITSS